MTAVIRIVIYSAIIFIASLFIFELGLRWFGLGDPILYSANSSFRYAPLPNQKKKRIHGATVTIDSHGLRATQDWNDQDSLKLLFIGDSITWGGSAIDDFKTFAHLAGISVEKSLGLPIVTGNAGVNNYGTDNMTARLRYENLGEDFIVIVLIPEDTIRGMSDLKSSYFFTRKPPWPFPALWELTTFSLWSISSSMRLIPDTLHPDSIAVATESLARLLDVLHAKHADDIPVLLVLSPYEEELGNKTGILTQHIQQMLANSGLPFLDLNHSLERTADRPIFTDGVHLNEIGHSVYANEISKYIVKLLSNRKNGTK